MKDFEGGVESFVESIDKTEGNWILMLIPLAIVTVAAVAGLLVPQPDTSPRVADAASLGIERLAPAMEVAEAAAE